MLLWLYVTATDALLPLSEAEADHDYGGSDAVTDPSFLVEAASEETAAESARAWMKVRDKPGIAEPPGVALRERQNPHDGGAPTVYLGRVQAAQRVADSRHRERVPEPTA